MIWIANQDPKKHSSWQPILGPKKSPSKSTYIEPKVHTVAAWGSGGLSNKIISAKSSPI